MEAIFEIIGVLLEAFFGERGERRQPAPLERARTPIGGVNRVRSRKRGRLYRGLWVRRTNA